MESQLRVYLKRYAKLEDQEFELFCARLQKKTFKKKEFLVEEGQVCQFRFFIMDGLVRIFHTNSKGHEKINLFAIENWWVTDLDSFIHQKPAFNAIQAIEDTSVYALHFKDLEELYSSIPELERIFRLITQNFAIALQRRNEIFMQQDSINKYKTLVNNIPNFEQRVPQYMIASYLDITPEYLSEIRKSILK